MQRTINDYPDIPKDLVKSIQRLDRLHKHYIKLQKEIENKLLDNGMQIYHTGRQWNWTMIKWKAGIER